jgi:hypothetical protein
MLPLQFGRFVHEILPEEAFPLGISLASLCPRLKKLDILGSAEHSRCVPFLKALESSGLQLSEMGLRIRRDLGLQMMSQVSRFSGLKQLRLDWSCATGNSSDIAPLASLGQLEELQVDYSPYPGLVSPKQLHVLQVVLSSCSQLRSLWLADVHVVEQGPLNSQSLQELRLGCVTPCMLPGGMDLSGLPCLSRVLVTGLCFCEGYTPHAFYPPETLQ